MSGNHSRRKGSTAERELFALLSEYLGIVCKRNLVQTREGGADTIDIPGIALEVKRRASWPSAKEINEMWAQACSQTDEKHKTPMLWVRADRGPWWAAVSLSEIGSGVFVDPHEYCLMRFEPACQWIRGQLNVIYSNIPS